MAVAALGEWSEFFVAQAGAAAVLAGLVFVGVSINLDKIIGIPSLPSRVLEASRRLEMIGVTSGADQSQPEAKRQLSSVLVTSAVPRSRAKRSP
jgi:hypothetical protein